MQTVALTDKFETLAFLTNIQTHVLETTLEPCKCLFWSVSETIYNETGHSFIVLSPLCSLSVDFGHLNRSYRLVAKLCPILLYIVVFSINNMY